MSYTKTNWQNTPSTQTPISAANLNHMEQGIYDAAQTADSAQSGVDGLDPRMDLVEQRLDNLIPQGTPTQGNAELIDIRVGANGVTYPDAGSAVRGQVTEIKSALSDEWNGTIPFIDGLISGEIVQGATGVITSAQSLMARTDYIEVDHLYNVICKSASGTEYNNCFFDENKQFISQLVITTTQTATKIPKSTNVYYLTSLVRLTNDKNYERKIKDLIETRKQKGKKESYCNVSHRTS